MNPSIQHPDQIKHEFSLVILITVLYENRQDSNRDDKTRFIAMSFVVCEPICLVSSINLIILGTLVQTSIPSSVLQIKSSFLTSQCSMQA